MALSWDGGVRPIWSIQAGTPRPMPGWTRPGYILAIVAISIARTPGWRTIAETMPSPTGTSFVWASTAVAPEMPPVKK